MAKLAILRSCLTLGNGDPLTPAAAYMPANDVKFGITKHAGTLIDSVDTTGNVQVAELRGSNGNVALVHPFNKTTAFSVKGHGTTAVVPGVGDSGISGLTGGVSVIEEFKGSEVNDNFDGWEYSGKHYPNADTIAAADPDDGP
jgi:hypothetical protein